MKTTKLTGLILVALLAGACTDNKKQETQEEQGVPVDSAVIGKDSTSVDVRRDIELNDAEKQTLPGRDTTNSDEPK